MSKPACVVINDGFVGHQIRITAAAAEKVAKGGPVFGEAFCGEYGRLKQPSGTEKLCAKCFRHDKRTVAEREIQSQSPVAAENILGLFGLKDGR